MKIKEIFKFIGENNSKYKNYKGIGDFDDNNNKHGYWVEFWDNENIFSKGYYINGVKNDYWEFYYNDGKLNSKGYFVNNKKEGYWEIFHNNGKLFWSGNYEDK